MSNSQDLPQEGKRVPTIDSNPGSDSDAIGSDEIIELTDVVGEDRNFLESNADAPLLLDEEKSDHHRAEFIENIIFGGTDPISGTAEKTEKTEDPVSEDPFSALESSDFKFETSPAFGAVDIEGFPGPSHERLDDVLADIEAEASAVEKPEEIADTHEIPGVSEEKMKELLTEVIQETVERAIRETVSEVAEKVIREAIEGLKKSIASSEDE